MTSLQLFWLSWCAGAISWLGAWRAMKGLTLQGAWCWTGLGWLAIGLSERMIQANTNQLGEPAWASALRFASMVAVFCPVMSVLGAKRPQHTAWHFIVFSLWGMLVLPAAEVLVLHPGQELGVHDARKWFLTAMVFLSMSHLVPTRFWLSGVLLGLGQWLLFAQYLPFTPATLQGEPSGWFFAQWNFLPGRSATGRLDHASSSARSSVGPSLAGLS